MSGKINFYYGVVGSRKSSELLLTAHRNKSVGKKVEVFQPYKNDRDGHVVSSRAMEYTIAVSYTHLTLPTTSRV